MVTPRARQEQSDLPKMPPEDEMYIQGELILNLRRSLKDKKDGLISEGTKLIQMMNDKRRQYIKVDGIKIYVKDIEAKEVLAFSENE